jgi:hypothetical protein
LELAAKFIRVSTPIIVTENREIIVTSSGDTAVMTVGTLTDAAQLAIEGLPSLDR